MAVESVNLWGREEEPVHNRGQKHTHRQPMTATDTCWATRGYLSWLVTIPGTPAEAKEEWPQRNTFISTCGNILNYLKESQVTHLSTYTQLQTTARKNWYRRQMSILGSAPKHYKTQENDWGPCLEWTTSSKIDIMMKEESKNRQGAGRKRTLDMKNGHCN